MNLYMLLNCRLRHRVSLSQSSDMPTRRRGCIHFAYQSCMYIQNIRIQLSISHHPPLPRSSGISAGQNVWSWRENGLCRKPFSNLHGERAKHLLPCSDLGSSASPSREEDWVKPVGVSCCFINWDLLIPSLFLFMHHYELTVAPTFQGGPGLELIGIDAKT